MKSWSKRLGCVLVLLGVALFAVWSARLALIGLSLREHLAQAQALADAPEAVDPVVACGLVQDLRDDVVALRRQAGWLVQLSPALSWLPEVGGDLRAAPHLLGVVDGLTEAGAVACDALEPALATFGGAGGDFSLEQMVQLLAEEQDDLKRALAAVERAQVAWRQVDTDSLSSWLAGKTELLDQGMPVLRMGLEMATVAPDLLGANGPHTYLVLAQNEDELRPTGGFISGVVQLTLDGGRITGMRFLDAYAVDDYAHKPYAEPPEPLLKYMGLEMWLFRDANWSPDFPTSARQAAYLYEYGQAVPTDGVIALDQYVVESLVGGLGEVRLPGAAEPVTAANARQFMREAWGPASAGATPGWIANRKEFIGQLATAILEQVETDPGSVDWVQVAKAIYRVLESRHLLIFVNDEDAGRVLARVGWDGALRGNDGGDYLMVVDANLGYGKANPLIDETVNYHVTLRTDGTAAAELSLSYVHRGQQNDVRCSHSVSYTVDLTYEAMINRCYYDYLRVYVPGGSVLRVATPHPTPGEYLILGIPADGQVVTLSGEAGKTVFAQFFVVEHGQTLLTHLEYDLPRIVRSSEGQQRYSLLIQKQAGTYGMPISLTIGLPPGVELLAVTPQPYGISEGALMFDLILDADILVEVVYQ